MRMWLLNIMNLSNDKTVRVRQEGGHQDVSAGNRIQRCQQDV